MYGKQIYKHNLSQSLSRDSEIFCIKIKYETKTVENLLHKMISLIKCQEREITKLNKFNFKLRMIVFSLLSNNIINNNVSWDTYIEYICMYVQWRLEWTCDLLLSHLNHCIETKAIGFQCVFRMDWYIYYFTPRPVFFFLFYYVFLLFRRCAYASARCMVYSDNFLRSNFNPTVNVYWLLDWESYG